PCRQMALKFPRIRGKLNMAMDCCNNKGAVLGIRIEMSPNVCAPAEVILRKSNKPSSARHRPVPGRGQEELTA
ncbi:MAG TPA: hypothetical protein VGR03_15915, partial [Candidatus Acidoferrum sp.]|nr:hypothetical protein [Candidatus Acidoferrum sp.]